MATQTDLRFVLPNPEATDQFGRGLARCLDAGDVLALTGPLGAGKSALARAIIRAHLEPLGVDEDIPSPSFTLVQSYTAGPLEIWHCDLYRLSHADEVLELGLDDAFDTALCLIEWPDRLGPDLPERALHISLAPNATEGRDLTLSWTASQWAERLIGLDKTENVD